VSTQLPAAQPVPQPLDAPPPDALLPDTFSARLYAALAPLAQKDVEVSWSLLVYCNAIGTMYQLIEDIVRDSPAGPGYSALLDVNRCPAVALPWLGQFVGVRVPPGLSEQAQRNWIASTDGFHRGTRDALIGAAHATLTPPGQVVFRERDGDPYYLTVITYTAQTPDPTATLNALLAQKPGGILLTYRTALGQDYSQLRARHATYAAVKAAYTDYNAVRTDIPS